jgi:hypothetical protein
MAKVVNCIRKWPINGNVALQSNTVADFLTLPGVIAISGPKGSGKTSMIAHIVYTLAKLNRIHYFKVFCPTLYNHSYDFIPEEHRHCEYNEPAIIELLDDQIFLQTKGVSRPAMLILDDCIGTTEFKSKIWDRIATTCRHPNLTVIVVTQYFTRLPPILRNNADTVLILRTIAQNDLKALYETCGTWKFRTLREFELFVLDNTKEFKCIFIKTGKSIQIGRAPAKIPKFKIKY